MLVFLQSQAFISCSNFISLLANICVLWITLYTLYLTAFSQKLSFVSLGTDSSMFYGEKYQVCLTNRSLHAIPIISVFLMKRIDGQFYRIGLRKYDDPKVIEPWHVGKLETKPFTTIHDMENEDGYVSMTDLHMDAVIGVEIGGDKVVWVKPYKHAPLKAARNAYRKFYYREMPVFRNQYNGQILSKSVKYAIHLLKTDINGQKSWECIFAIIGQDGIIFDKTVNGYNGIDKKCNTAKELKKCLCKKFGISKEQIVVQEL